MANQVGPQDEGFESLEVVDVLWNAPHLVVGQVEFAQRFHVQQTRRNGADLVGADAEALHRFEFAEPGRQGVDAVFVEDEFAELAEPAQSVVDLLPFGPGEVEPKDALRPLQGFLEIGPDPGRVPAGLSIEGGLYQPARSQRRRGARDSRRGCITESTRRTVISLSKECPGALGVLFQLGHKGVGPVEFHHVPQPLDEPHREGLAIEVGGVIEQVDLDGRRVAVGIEGGAGAHVGHADPTAVAGRVCRGGLQSTWTAYTPLPG